jgi:P63C domain
MADQETVADYAAQGGKARAEALTRDERKEIARVAANARWEKAGKPPILRATHTGEVNIGGKLIPCAVLEDGTRVLSENGITQALLGSRSGASKRLKRASMEDGAPVPLFLAPKRLKPFISNELIDGPLKPLAYQQGQGTVDGFSAEALPIICDIWLRARDAGVLQKQQLGKAKAAEILMRGLAHVAIVALVDEATGYQDARAKDALAKILEAFIAKELRKWVSTFPVEYYKELFRLRGWKFPELPADQRKRPVLVGKITNDVVYDRLAPGVRQELNRLTPRDEKGRLKHKLFQRLTEDVGHPKLREHLASVVTLMRASDDWKAFAHMLNRALPRYGDTPYLPFEG